jgi:hypothetical protein
MPFLLQPYFSAFSKYFQYKQQEYFSSPQESIPPLIAVRGVQYSQIAKRIPAGMMMCGEKKEENIFFLDFSCHGGDSDKK